MSMVRALTVGVDENLALFCAYLGQRRVPHRVFEEQGMQVLEVASALDAEQVRSAYAAWREGGLQLEWRPGVARPKPSWRAVLRRYPVVVVLMGAAVLAFPATWGLDAGVVGPLLPWLTIVPIDSGSTHFDAAALGAVLAAGQWWRLVTPVFIHFGSVHLLFNAAFVIEFGRRIERGAGSLLLLTLVVLVAVVSNVSQFVVTLTPLFGGLSGVAYGLFAYVVVRGRFDAARDWQVNRSFIVVVVIFLVLMSSGITEMFGMHIANTAHWVGLVIGSAIALVWRPVRPLL